LKGFLKRFEKVMVDKGWEKVGGTIRAYKAGGRVRLQIGSPD
jgi:hypothetical protein